MNTGKNTKSYALSRDFVHLNKYINIYILHMGNSRQNDSI
jgi:hypothetical protein